MEKKMSTILLVVDDEPDVQLLMKQKFRKEIRDDEYDFLFAANGVEALEILEKNPGVEVILCDVNMPQMDGITLLSKTRELNQTAQTIIVSAYGDMRNIRRAMNHGAFDFVTKPINFGDLGATIEKTIRHVKKLKENIEEKERLYSELARYNKELEERVEERTAEISLQKAIIEGKNQSITESINYAKRIQEASFPSVEILKSTVPDSFVFFRPRDIVSGDFYWFADKNGKFVIAGVDCTGHGVPGAFMSLIGNDLLNVIVSARGITDPAEILNELHTSVRKALRQEENNSRDGMDLSVCVFDFENKTMSYAGAKSPLIYFTGDTMHLIKGDKVSVGGVQKEETRRFTKHIFPLEKNSVFYIFTDGYQDQFGTEGQKFMSKRFRKLLQDIHALPCAEQQQLLEKNFLSWKGNKPQIDDILVLGLRF
jgi:CheY-like chemotaxis protein